MKIVADNHADSLRRPGAATQADALDAVAADLRALLGEVSELPEGLVALARRFDAERGPEALAA